MLSMLVTVGLIMAILGFPLFFIGLIMLLVKTIRRTGKKSAIKVIVVSVVLIASGFVLSLLDTNSIMADEMSQSNMGKAEEKVRSIIYEKYMSSMLGGDIKSLTVDFTTKNADGDNYTFYGKYTILDNYNEKYVGKFEISITYIETYDDGSVSFEKNFVNISNAIKQN